jgi:hypothetical protein
MNGAKILLPAIFHHGPHLWSLEHPDRAITMFRKTRNSSGVVVEHIPAPQTATPAVLLMRMHSLWRAMEE